MYLNKLLKENITNIHKILGLISILNFIYKYFYCLPLINSLNYNSSSVINNFTLLCHLLLSLSSVLFQYLKIK